MSLIIVTGMSGAGKSTAIDALEDIGYFCVDNVPPQLVDRFAMLRTSGSSESRMAVVVDVRAGELFSQFGEALDRLQELGRPYRLLFLDAQDDVLLDRYKEGRRRHPLIGRGATGLPEAIALERRLLEDAKARADFVVDSSRTSAATLKGRIAELFRDAGREAMTVECLSFGFKNGIPHEADLVFDVRCLPNPFYVEALKRKTGLDGDVRDYVMNAPESQEMLSRILGLLDFSLPLYAGEGKSHLVVAFGCTGGHHRSVTFAQLAGEHLRARFPGVAVVHRDLEKG